MMSKTQKEDKEKTSIIIPPGFQLDEDLTNAWHYMEFTQESIFLTGRAGTGKSSLLNYFRKNSKKKIVVLAPTGLAALHVGGSTVHSFFGFPLRMMMKNDPEIHAWSKGHPRLNIVKKMETLIIDEVSMLRADLLDAIDYSLRLNMQNDLPFGGKQLIFIGDVFQLSPVITSTDQAYYQREDAHESPYFFSAESFRNCQPKIIQLKKIYRQHDEDFIYLLNRIRMGSATVDDLAELNKRFSPDINYQKDFAITLTSVNAAADAVNLQRLQEISNTSFTYSGKVEGNFNERNFPAPSMLRLKVGAQVMMVKNDVQGRWVNGSIGKVERLSQDEVMISFADGSVCRVESVTWENKSYTWDRSANAISVVVQGTYTQLPIRLAWAITIHKSQGLTFDNIVIDMGRGAFAHGQLYVALSRCKTLEGITLKTKIAAKDMIVDEAVENFSTRFRMH